MKNLMPEVAKLLGVEIGEEFRIDNPGSDGRYKINELGDLMYAPYHNGEWSASSCFTIASLLNCLHQIIKLPWKPKPLQEFWYVNSDGRAICCVWSNFIVDWSLYKLGNCFRTKKKQKPMLTELEKK